MPNEVNLNRICCVVYASQNWHYAMSKVCFSNQAVNICVLSKCSTCDLPLLKISLVKNENSKVDARYVISFCVLGCEHLLVVSKSGPLILQQCSTITLFQNLFLYQPYINSKIELFLH